MSNQATNTAAAAAPTKAKKPSIVDTFLKGCAKGFKVGIENITPAMILGYVLVYILKETGLMDILGTVMSPVMGLFGLPGMILGVPVFAIIYAYTSGAINSKLREKEMPTDTLVYEDFSKYHIDKEEIFGKERFEAARRLGERDTKPTQRE